MKVSEKTLELNIGAEILWLLRRRAGLKKLYLRGLTQREEKAEGVDFFAQMNPKSRLFAFQFKAPKGKVESEPYKFRLVDYQHSALFKLGKRRPQTVFYAFPFFVGPPKVQKLSPALLDDTWFLDVGSMPEKPLFGGRRSRTIVCTAGIAKVNPEYHLTGLSGLDLSLNSGLSPEEFGSWYSEFRVAHRAHAADNDVRRDPWLSRGLRIAIAPPESNEGAT